MLVINNLVKRFGQKEAVKELSFTVEKGTAFGLLGPNGAGKSTTIGMICGLITPTAGEILIGGIPSSRESLAARQMLGVVPQEIALYPTLTAGENLRFWGRLYGLSGRVLDQRVDEALEIVALKERQKEQIRTYSGGMKRRINIAAALLHRPALLIMDEPTVGIDPQSRNAILETVQRLNREMGITLLYTSHYMEEVEFLCQRVGIIDHGELIAQGSLDEVRRLGGNATTVRLRLTQLREGSLAAVAALPGVDQVHREEEALVALVRNPEESLGPMLSALLAAGEQLQGVEMAQPNLESVFLSMTGRALRD